MAKSKRHTFLCLFAREMHDSYVNNSYNYNRGILSLIRGKLDLSVGKKCPDEALDKIKKSFCMDKYDIVVYRTADYDKTF